MSLEFLTCELCLFHSFVSDLYHSALSAPRAYIFGLFPDTNGMPEVGSEEISTRPNDFFAHRSTTHTHPSLRTLR